MPADLTSAKFTANFFAVTSAQGVTMMERAGNVLKSFMLQLNAAVLALTINATGVAFCDVPATTSATQPALLTSRGSEPVAINAATLTGAGRTMSGVEFPKLCRIQARMRCWTGSWIRAPWVCREVNLP